MDPTLWSVVTAIAAVAAAVAAIVAAGAAARSARAAETSARDAALGQRSSLVLEIHRSAQDIVQEALRVDRLCLDLKHAYRVLMSAGETVEATTREGFETVESRQRRAIELRSEAMGTVDGMSHLLRNATDDELAATLSTISGQSIHIRRLRDELSRELLNVRAQVSAARERRR